MNKREINQILDLFNNINNDTGILTNQIIREPNEKERDQLWNFTQKSLDFIYDLK